jgi:hypothetical protein
MSGAFRVALSELRIERRGKTPQLYCVHRCEFARGLHGLKYCHILSDINSLQSAYFSEYSDLRAFIEPLPREPHDDRLQLLVR